MTEIVGLRRPIVFLSVGLGLAYGLLTRLIFGLDLPNDWFEIMSVSFIFGVPVVIGFITVFLSPPEKTARWWMWIFLPWISSCLTIVAALILAWEGLICAIVWVPLFGVLASVGGVLAGVVGRVLKASASRGLVLVSVVLLPFVASPLEQRFLPPTRHYVVTTQIEIESDPATIWENIREVPAILEAEHGTSFSHTIGFPRPIEAKLIGEGVGAVRHATFERGVLFVETVTEWVPEERLSFTIEADAAIPPTTFDQHVVVGGRYFDVLSGSYRIDRVGPNKAVLTLSSRQRLSTRFNAYTQRWTNYFMNDIQQYILEVIKQRCEREAA